jgi:hypothetical protein
MRNAENRRELLIELTWDADACVWIAESEDVPCVGVRFF